MTNTLIHYEINVTLNGIHFFATHERSITEDSKLERVVDVFKEKFPKSEGYEIKVTEWKMKGSNIDV